MFQPPLAVTLIVAAFAGLAQCAALARAHEVPQEYRPRIVGGGTARIAVEAPRDKRFAHLSWPKVVRRDDGTIVLAYIAGVFHGDHGGGSPAVSVSTDEGKTFTSPQVLRRFGPEEDYTQSGNLALGIAPDGAFVLLAMAYTGTGKGIVGTAGVGNHIYGWRSTDGRSWTPTDTSALGPNITGSVFGNICPTSDGKLAVLGHYRAPSQPAKGIWLAMSNDDGRTWGKPRQITDVDAAEPLLLVTEKRWLAFLRSKGSGRQYVSVSDDAGTTWTTSISALAPPPQHRLAAPFAVVNPANKNEVLALTTERVGSQLETPSKIQLWRGSLDKLAWKQERALIEFPKSADNPNTDLGYVWLLPSGAGRWQLYFYYGRGHGENSIWVADVTIE